MSTVGELGLTLKLSWPHVSWASPPPYGYGQNYHYARPQFAQLDPQTWKRLPQSGIFLNSSWRVSVTACVHSFYCVSVTMSSISVPLFHLKSIRQHWVKFLFLQRSLTQIIKIIVGFFVCVKTFKILCKKKNTDLFCVRSYILTFLCINVVFFFFLWRLHGKVEMAATCDVILFSKHAQSYFCFILQPGAFYF